MRAWRLVKAEFVKNAFTGDGARLAGGRWNPKGVPVVYTSSSLALATLELIVHADYDLLPDDLMSFALDIPDDIPVEHVAIGDLPSNWKDYPPPEALQEIGAMWFARRETAVLAVTSAVISEENNFLLNPVHPDFTRIRWAEPQPFQFDSRLQPSMAIPRP